MCGTKTVKLYAIQAPQVLDAIERDGVCYSKSDYVRRKYGESAPVFLAAYGWFVQEAEKIVPKPVGAEYPYWAFQDPHSIDTSAGGILLKLRVPCDEAVFFDASDWNRILQLSYLGLSGTEERAFSQELAKRGLNGNQIMLTAFYLEWKQAVMESWKRLFRHHREILAGDTAGVENVQAALWRIKREWIQL